jgi:metal-responsive CopG/Arc/MetJ family transcriptional regulator
MTLDDELVNAVDRAARKLKTTRSAFTRRALREALTRIERTELETRHRGGYERQPIRNGEFDAWEGEQRWGEP